jgi:hypothetical protein
VGNSLFSNKKRQFGIRKKMSLLLSVMLFLQLALPTFVPAFQFLMERIEAAAGPKYITFLYEDFKQAAERLQFNGAASVTSEGKLRLTPANYNQFGSVFNTERVSLSASSAFSTYFVFQTSGQGGVPAGADGFVFTLQTASNNAGGLGNGIGYGGLDGGVGIRNSLGVEFDMYNNNDAIINDSSDNHIGIHIDGTVRHGGGKAYANIDKSRFNFKSGNAYHAWIEYNGSTIEVYLNDNNQRPSSPVLSQSGVNLRSILGSDDVYAGFTSATGGAFQNHDILKWYFTNKYDPIDPTCGCYVEAPSLFTVTTSVYQDVYHYTNVRLKNSAGQPGALIPLTVSRPTNISFLNDEFESLGGLPAATTDPEGKATYLYSAVTPGNPLPSFRVSTEFGAYTDVRTVLPPSVVTGAITPSYPDMRATVVSNLTDTGGGTVFNWGVQVRRLGSTDTDWQSYPGVGVKTSGGEYPVTVSGLQEDVPYEARAYAENSSGIRYGDAVFFIVQMPMSPEDVQYTRIGPSHLFVNDEMKLQVVGRAFHKLEKKYPPNSLKVTVSRNGVDHSVSLDKVSFRNESLLELSLPEGLSLGAYDVKFEHPFFGNHTFANAFTITDDPIYKSRKYDEIVVMNPNADPRKTDEVDRIILRGPFIAHGSEPDVFRLNDPDAVVTINDNLLFKGSSLVIDKSDPSEHTIRGNGRLYVNGQGALKVMTAYTIHEGDFEFTADNFEFKVGSTGSYYDYIGMNMPAVVESFTFIPGGIRVKGNIEVEFMAGSTKIKGGAEIDALEFKRNRVDLDADFKLEAEMKTGPVESSEIKVGVDTRVPEYGFGAAAQLRKYKIGFEMELGIHKSKLDTVKFAINKKIKIGNTGAQFTKIGGGVSNMANRAAPLTFHLLGGLSDAVTPVINGENLANAKNLDIGLSINHFEASGELAIYTIKVADLDLFVVANPTGLRGFNKAGFQFEANVNIIDVLIGEIFAKYFQGSSFNGHANVRVQIPRNITLIGGHTLARAGVAVNDRDMKAGLSVIGIGFKIAYFFSNKKVDFDVDMASTVKNVAKAVVNVGSKVVSGVTSFAKKLKFWYEDGGKNGKRVMVLSTDSASSQAEVIGEKLFEPSGTRARSLGTSVPGQVTTLISETNPKVQVVRSGDSRVVEHSFTVDKPYRALMVLRNADPSLRLVNPNGEAYALNFSADRTGSVNAVYDASSQTVIAEVDINRNGEWKLQADETVGMELHQVSYRNATLGLPDIAASLITAERIPMATIELAERDTFMLEVVNASADTVLYKPDGRPYQLEMDHEHPAWNTYRISETVDGEEMVSQYIAIEVAEPGTWAVDAGADTEINVFRMKPGTSMDKVRAWMQASDFGVPLDFRTVMGSQILLEVENASEHTKLYLPNGEVYPLETDRSKEGWNAKFDAEHRILTVLVDVNKIGVWVVKSDGFTQVTAMLLDQKVSMEELNGADAKYAYTLIMDETGRYAFEIAGGNETTSITGPDGKSIAIITDEARADRNAIQDSVKGSLLVTVDVEKPGELVIGSVGPISIKQYKLPPLPQITQLEANAQPGLNTYELSWRVENPKPDTKVRVVLTDNPEYAAGETIAELPTTGVSTITLPSGYLPGKYWLALVADSEMFGPIFKVMDQPIDVTAPRMLPTPQEVQAVPAGNGEIKLSFKDTGWQEVTSYRVLTADGQGHVNYNGPSMDAVPSQGDSQEITVTGFVPGEAHSIAVMAISEKEDTWLVSEPSAVVTVEVPVPTPPTVSVSLNMGGASMKEYLVMPLYVTDEMLAGLSVEEQERYKEKVSITSASQLVVEVTSSQAGTVEVFANGQSLGAQHVTVGQGVSFPMTGLVEREYAIAVETVNEQGDRSSYYETVFIDRTAPHLSLKNPVNGGVFQGDRATLIGATEAGVLLTVNGTAIPVDQAGHFAYAMPIPGSGVLPIHIVAQDFVGNQIEHRLEVLAVDGPSIGQRADLAGLAIDEGVLSTTFSSEVQDYVSSVDARVKQLRVSAVPIDPDSVVRVNGEVASWNHTSVVDLSDGTSVIRVTVTAPDNSMKEYRIQLKAESELAALKKLSFDWDPAEVTNADSAPMLSPSFGSTKEFYDMEVGHAITKTRVIPTTVISGSLVRVNGTEVSSGHPSEVIPLAVGENTISVQVLSVNEAEAARPDWSKAKSYTVKVLREASDNANMSSLTIDGVQLAPQRLDPYTFHYDAVVRPDEASVRITASAEHSGAVISIDGEAVDSSGSKQVGLSQGVNRLSVVVQAQNGRSQTYELTIVRPLPINPELNLAKLEVQGQQFSTAFSPWSLNYDLKYNPIHQDILTVQAVSDEPGVKVTVSDREVNREGKAIVPLKEGNNVVLVRVESADGVESKTYAIGVVYVSESEAAPKPIFDVRVNEIAKSNIAKADRKTEDGKDVIRVTFIEAELDKTLSNERQRPIITIPVEASPDTLVSELTGQMVKKLEDKEAVLDIRTGQVSYTLPAAALQIDKIGRQLGADGKLNQIKVQVIMMTPSAEQRNDAKQGAERIGAGMLTEPVEFQVVYTYEGKEVESDRFNQYVERSIGLPDGVERNQITTGVRVHADGSLYHIPTYVHEADGRFWASMKSYSNSAYTIIHHSKTFADVKGHWSEAAVTALASRLVVDGKGADQYAPDAQVTRAEFAAIVMRSLGLAPVAGNAAYADVASSDWYASVVATASEYGLISGYEDKTFRPNQPISRAEAAIILSRAWRLAGKELPSDEDAGRALVNAMDASDVPGWAKTAVGSVAALGMMQGYEDGSVKPDRQITRAETAALLHKLLVKSELIQP